jgi:protein-S-isoprenylcysteine O-methyltransferase Ste14
VIISLLGLLLTIVAALNLGKNLTPLPCPKEGAQLIQGGLYRIVRHPIYFGVLLVALGWLLIYPYAFVLVYVIALFIFFDLKTRCEEIWLIERFPAYLEYKQKVYVSASQIRLDHFHTLRCQAEQH